MNIIKTKLRNRMKVDLLNSVLSIREGLKREGSSCHAYALPDQVVKLVGTMAVYKDSGEFAASEDEEESLPLL